MRDRKRPSSEPSKQLLKRRRVVKVGYQSQENRDEIFSTKVTMSENALLFIAVAKGETNRRIDPDRIRNLVQAWILPN